MRGQGGRGARCRGDDGISLIELLVAVGLMVLIVPLAFPMLTSTLTSAGRLEARSATLDELRSALGNLNRELRAARCVQEPVIAPGEVEVAGDTLRFVTATSGGDVEVTYAAGSGELVRTTEADTRVVVPDLVPGDPVFRYVADPRQRVDVRLAVTTGAGRAPVALDTTTAPRSAWHAC